MFSYFGSHQCCMCSVAVTEVMPIFMPPAAAAIVSSESLINHFPLFLRTTILEIICHEIQPLNLYKLNSNAHEKATDLKSTVDFEDSHLTIKDSAKGVKDYPSFASLLNPLLIYFSILGAHALSANSTSSVFSLMEACNAYTSSLSWLNRTYQWSVVITQVGMLQWTI